MTQEEFLFGENGDNHRPLLWFALELTKENRLPVIEYGAGHNSTSWLRQYCKDDGREFCSYDNNKRWAEQFGSVYVDHWHHPFLYIESSVVLIDQGPAEERHKSIEYLQDKCDIIVVHDTEPKNSNSYRLHLIWDLFKYKIDCKGNNIWTTALSNKIDLTKYENTLIGNFKLELHEHH